MSKSVADALTDIAASLGTLLTQINAKLALKGVSTGASDMAEVPDKINAIVTGSGIDTSDANATAADILKPHTAYVNGFKLTGTLEITSRSASDVTVSGRTVTVPAGNYSSQVQKSVAAATQATPSISVNTSTGVVTATASQSAGYVSSGSKSATYSLPTQAAQTITPGTGNQTIALGRYLTGTQTILGDGNLKASNIKKNVSIFGVNGSYEAESSGGANIEISHGNTATSNIEAQRTGGGLIAISGITVLFGRTLVGVCLYKASYTESSDRIQSLFVISNGGTVTGIMWQKFNESYPNTNLPGQYLASALADIDIQGSYCAVTLKDTSITGGFDSGIYRVYPIFSY